MKMGCSKFTKFFGLAFAILFISAANTYAADARAPISNAKVMPRAAAVGQVPAKVMAPANAIRKLASSTSVVNTHNPANSAVLPRVPASVHDEGIDITGQSRNLSMGLMFQRDKDTVSFGSPRTNYKDKITTSQTNY
jgi:hypothetical protein